MMLVRRLMVFVLSGALVGLIVGSLIGPKYLVWYNQPGAGIAQCNCTEVAKKTAEDLIGWQLWSALGGSAAFLVVGLLILWPKRKQLAGGTSGSTPGAATTMTPPP